MTTRLRKSGIAALVGVAAGVGGAVLPATPVAAHHQQTLTSPGGAGTVTVGYSHNFVVVCGINGPTTGEFLMSTLVIQRRTANGQCLDYSFGEEVERFRACDARGCTAWKNHY